MNKQIFNIINSLKHAFQMERMTVVSMPMFKWMNYGNTLGAE